MEKMLNKILNRLDQLETNTKAELAEVKQSLARIEKDQMDYMQGYLDDKLPQKTFGQNITKLRESQGLSQKDLAEKLNVAQATICRIEKCIRNPSLDLLCDLARFFNVSLDYLVRKNDN